MKLSNLNKIMAQATRRSTRSSNIKRQLDESNISDLPPPSKKAKKVKKEEPKQEPGIKEEKVDQILNEALPKLNDENGKPLPDTKLYLKERKLKTYSTSSSTSPFPTFAHPTAQEAKTTHAILARLHGARARPKTVIANPDRAGCGDSPSVLDALVRTILSQNTSDGNSARAKRSMDAEYGGSDRWEDIVAGGQERLEGAIRCGGLSKIKSRVIFGVLESAKEKYGAYTLDSLFDVSNEEAVRELIALKGVGIKTAACVLMFCLQRDVFPVDTHVHRLTGILGWRPAKASRDETFFHLDSKIPEEDKYGLHILLIKHGKACAECKAGGKGKGKGCEMRQAIAKEI
jgi:endonuclease-3